MPIKTPFTAQEALLAAMVIMAASGKRMSDAEIALMVRLVGGLPAFAETTPEDIARVSEHCTRLLNRTDGLEDAFTLMRDALPMRLRETAYLLACEVAAADGDVMQEELRLLANMRLGLDLDLLVAGAIERAARARYQVL
jgi:tellurite resistance protein